MASGTEISWCDSTMNPWIGCSKISPGCDNCYAATQDKFRKWTPEGWGGPRKRTSEALWRQPVKWNDEPFYACGDCGWRGTFPAGKDRAGLAYFACAACGKDAHPARRRVFCASLADVFDNEVDPAWRADLFFLIEQTPNLDWLLLTKRIGNAQRMLAETSDYLASVHRPLRLPLPNVWLGATVVNQEEADRDIPKLLRVPARVRFLSCEPLLGRLQLWRLNTLDYQEDSEGAEVYPLRGLYAVPDCDWPGPKLDWVIVGGESGHKARDFDITWARSIVEQCKAAGVAVHVKQMGAKPVWSEADDGVAEPPFWGRIKYADRDGRDAREWPADLRVQQFPEVAR